MIHTVFPEILQIFGLEIITFKRTVDIPVLKFLFCMLFHSMGYAMPTYSVGYAMMPSYSVGYAVMPSWGGYG